MIIIISTAFSVIFVSIFLLYTLTWKRDLSKRCSKLDKNCISNSLLKYRRKNFIFEVFTTWVALDEPIFKNRLNNSEFWRKEQQRNETDTSFGEKQRERNSYRWKQWSTRTFNRPFKFRLVAIFSFFIRQTNV